MLRFFVLIKNRHMETSIIQQIKKQAGKLIEPQLLKAGRVLEVRLWEPSTIIEIDLHLPEADMQQWTEIPYIKFRVANLTYRDYSPSGWDADTRTCTIFVDAKHNGPGSQWARQLQKNDMVQYYKTGTTHQKPESTTAVVGLGDESSLGHLLALQQMVMPVTRFSGAVLMSNSRHSELFNEYFRSPLQPVQRTDIYGHHSLIQWLSAQKYTLDNVVFYLAGNNTMVAQLRKMLRNQGYSSNQIRAQGFWS
jgi:NADPH-dependent ferric siderophore reductase